MPNRKPLSKLLATRATAYDEINWLDLLPDPDRILEKLSLPMAEAYKNIETDDKVTSVRGSRSAAVKSLNWDIFRGKAQSQATKKLEMIFDDYIDMDRFIDDIMMANPWGMGPIEVSWEYRDNLAIPILGDRPARWFTFDVENKPKFLSRKSGLAGEEIKPRTLLLPRNNPTYDNPYGERLLSKSQVLIKPSSSY